MSTHHGLQSQPIPPSSATWFGSEDFKPENSVVNAIPEERRELIADHRVRRT
jgi:hypothetical protein